MSGEFVDPYPWLREDPSHQDDLFRAMLAWAEENKWPHDETGEHAFRHAEIIDRLADDALTFDIPYDAVTPDNAKPIPTIRELSILNDDALAAAFNRAPDRLQRLVEDTARRVDARLDPSGAWIVAAPFLRRVLTRLAGTLKGRPNSAHIDAVTDAALMAYCTLSARKPGLSRPAEGGPLGGPTVRFVDMVGAIYDLPLGEENRLRASMRRARREVA